MRVEAEMGNAWMGIKLSRDELVIPRHFSAGLLSREGTCSKVREFGQISTQKKPMQSILNGLSGATT